MGEDLRIDQLRARRTAIGCTWLFLAVPGVLGIVILIANDGASGLGWLFAGLFIIGTAYLTYMFLHAKDFSVAPMRANAEAGLGTVAQRTDETVILEHAVLPVVAGQESAFLEAFAQARPIIAGMPGFRSLRLSRSLESPREFLLLVEWNSLEDHTVGFRGSAEYQLWKSLLHKFYDPFPEVQHFVDQSSVDRA